jgi:hypothetical protein
LTTALGNANSQISNPVPILLTKEVQDLFIRKNFQNLVNYFSSQNQFVNFNFFELNIPSAVTAQTMNHNLGYLPKDVVVTQVTGVGSVTFLYGKFTNTTFSYSSSGACRVRFFIGTYINDASTTTAQSTDQETFVPIPLTATQNLPVAVTGDYTMLGTEYLLRVTTTGIGNSQGAKITLPLGVAGLVMRIQKVDKNTNPVSIFVNGKNSGSIIPAINSLTAQWESVEMIFDGTNWCVFSKWSGT